MPLSEYFKDDDADLITITANYSLNGGPAISISGGLFTLLPSFTIVVESKGQNDVGSYTISVYASDSL
jgi:hypothetical protein